ncbi:hypothetical protein ZWY2020_031305 [Hordeum vulgare]|nr:hypothetical protein ZWY2020_031305 [Hordeum vulgare]
MARASNVPGISGHLRGRATTTAAAAHHGPLLRRRRRQRRGRPPAHRLPPFDDAEDDTTDVVAADGSAGGYASFMDAGYPSSADAGAKEEEEVVDEEIAADSDGAAVPVRYVSDGYAPRPSSPTRTSGAGTTTAPSCPRRPSCSRDGLALEQQEQESNLMALCSLISRMPALGLSIGESCGSKGDGGKDSSRISPDNTRMTYGQEMGTSKSGGDSSQRGPTGLTASFIATVLISTGSKAGASGTDPPSP